MSNLKDTPPARVLHCWEDGPRTDDDCGTTCMLPRDHTGPHQFTRDDQIGVRFATASKNNGEQS